MTSVQDVDQPILIREFTAAKQIGLFATLKQPPFSGQLVLKAQQVRWDFYLYLGRIIYATGGPHTVRRWRRNLVTVCPQLLSADIQADLASLSVQDPHFAEYQLLCLWVEQQKITKKQAAKIIWSTVVEVLFDVTQATEIVCELKPSRYQAASLTLINPEQAVAEAKELWQAWQDAKLADRSPNLAPVIVRAEQLKQKTSEQAYQNLSQLLDGQQSLRDIAVRMKRDVLSVTRSLLRYFELGLVKLVPVGDLPPAIKPPQEPPASSQARQALIACIDDSPAVCDAMKRIITQAGHQFLGINDPLRAIATLLARKPDLIFLDLVMPNANGYEICSQLRKMSFFRQTPIVILTGNDGIIDRARAKMVGSSDFLGKPVRQEVLIGVIDKYLKSPVGE
ncbi:MAG: response regulator [Cyanophyceae cyanobacterium]